MRKLLIFFIALTTFNVVKAQSSDTTSIYQANRDSIVFTAVEHEPEFNGGDIAFLKYLGHNIHYPAKSRENHIQGKVFISFIVEKDGSLSDLKVVRGVSDDIDAEALRILKESPNWIPGTQNGKAVRVAYTIPVSFALANK